MKKYLALALLASAPFAANAAELHYSFVELGYSKTEFSDSGDSVKADGYAVKAQGGFGDAFYGAVGVHKESLHGDDIAPWELTGGYHHAPAEGTDLVTEISYIGLNSRFGGTSYHNDGYRAAVGVRSAVGEHVELGAKLTWTGVENFDDVVGVNLNGLVKFNDMWGIYGQYHFKEYNFLDADADTWQVGVRASF